MATLRGKKPTTIEKRFKAFFYGSAGVGKTTAAIQFPAPYLIDTEKGAEQDQYTQLLEKNGGVIFQCADFDEIYKEVLALLTVKHEYKTLVIDPMTTVYNNLLEQCELTVGTEFGRHYGEANKRMKKLINLLLRLDMNVIVTSHAKKEYGDKLVVLGETFDCYKKLDYIFDLCIEIRKDGRKRYGFVRKSRIAAFEELSNFEFSYENVSKMYGKKIIEKESAAQEISTPVQIKEIKRLIKVLKVEDETIQKWLKKADASSFEDMESSKLQACIEHLNSKIKGEEL